jgi:hypothetical protein
MPSASPCLDAATPRFGVCGPADPRRAEVEAFIRDVYRQHYGAQLRSFAPELVYLHDAQGIVAAAGYRGAGQAELFLERYLDAPVQTLLPCGPGATPARDVIVEVGHLAATRSGEGRRLILLLGPHLARQGFHWVVSTLTEELRRLFLRIGVTWLTLSAADAVALGGDAVHWGSYYEHRPLVLAGHLPQALRHLAGARRAATP